MNKALKFIILFGIISLFADIVYEGARSITGPYLALLGASGTTVGWVIGLGELIGYGMRVLSGYLSDKTGRYWLITFVGYIINLFAVPCLALAGNWQMASFLIILERFGKAIRVPAKDAMLSYATKHTGRGYGFGLHEALDQIGAVIGPLAIAAILFFHGSYQMAFAILVIPALAALCCLIVTRLVYPTPQDMEVTPVELTTKGFSKSYWIYILAISLVAAGYVDFALIAFHFKKASTVASSWIPLFYAIAMAVDGLSALVIGRLFDIKGVLILAFVTGISAFFCPLVFWGNFYGALIGMILWGIGMGSQESIMKALVAVLVAPKKRGSAYGIMHLVFGLFWAAGSALMGFFYDINLFYLVLFSLITQLGSIPIFLSLHSSLNKGQKAGKM
jgi:MFS family permease